MNTQLASERPDRRAGNCVHRRGENSNHQPKKYPDGKYERKDSAYGADRNRSYSRDRSSQTDNRPRQSSGFRKPMNKSRNPRQGKNKPRVDIPSFMIPKINTTVQNRFTVFEEGGAFEVSNGICVKGNSKIIMTGGQRPKRPIYVYNKRKIAGSSSFGRSMLFHIHNGDLVIAESHMIGKTVGTSPSFISVFVFRAAYYTDQHGTRRPRYDLVARVSKRFETTELLTKIGFISTDPALMKIVRDQLYDVHYEYLTEMVGKAIDKSNSQETSYTYYHNSKLADKMKSVCLGTK